MPRSDIIGKDKYGNEVPKPLSMIRRTANCGSAITSLTTVKEIALTALASENAKERRDMTPIFELDTFEEGHREI